MKNFRGEYSGDWKTIATEVKDAAEWHCIRCGHEHDAANGYCLTVHHFNGDKAENMWWNLLALCQRCHLHIQAKVDPENPWIFEHSEWLKPYVAGFYAQKYLSAKLSRKDVEERLLELLKLEQKAA